MTKSGYIVLTIVMGLMAGCKSSAPTTSVTENAPIENKVAVAPKTTNTTVMIVTSKGNIKVELFEKNAPATVKNFLGYVDDKFYDQTIFHRVIQGFMIQGGGFTEELREKKTKVPVANEANNGLKNTRGTLAMARTPEVNSATSQFFINVADNPALDYRDATVKGFGYCVFGKVVEGLDVVDSIVAVKTTRRGPHDDVPRENITIRSISRKQ